jgi:3',5'-cyclic AMP phosphodiesterase CpdA
MGLWPGCATAPAHAANSSFRFIVVNDTHYMSEECGGWLERVVAQMKTHSGAEFCLLVGDLVEKGERSHLAAVSEIFGGLRIPVYVQIGNHDYLINADRSGYESVFPRRLNYWFEHQGWQFVGFDSTEGTRYENTTIQPSTLGWLRHTVPKLNRTAPTVIFTHFPLGAGVKYRPNNADDALDFFREHNLRAVFNGHFHGQTEREWNLAPVVTNKCCALKRGNHDGTREKGYFICAVKDGLVSREFVQIPG